MTNILEADGTLNYLLPPILAAAGLSFVWLLVQTASRRRPGWISSVAIPAGLAGYSAVAVLPKVFGATPPGTIALLAALAAALGAGFLFDRSSSLNEEGDQLVGRRSPWPMMLWGAGTFLFVLAPAANLEARQAQLEHLSGAFSLVGAGALTSQLLNWSRRLLRIKRLSGTANKIAPATRPGLATRIVGGVAALIGVWLLFQSGQQPKPFNDVGTKAPRNSLLVGTGSLESAPIYVLNMDTLAFRPFQLTGGWARWSPEGTRLAITRKDGNFMQLFVAAADGSSAHRLTTMPGDVLDCIWSADGQQIFFLHGQSFLQSALWVVPAGGGTTEEVLPKSEAVGFPAFSPVGSMLAYYRGTDFGAGILPPPTEIKLFDLSSRQPTVLVSQPTNDWIVTALTWTPDGRALIIGTGSNISGRPYQLERVAIADRQRHPLGAALQYYPRSFTWTADGSKLAMVLQPSSGGNLGPGEIWLVDADNGDKRRLETTDGSIKPATIHASPIR